MTIELLQQVAAKQEITENLYRYCRSVDRLDLALGHSIWNPDSTADYGSFYQGDGPGVIDLICKQHSYMLYHTHQISNVIIELDDDTAGSESYVMADLRHQRGDSIVQMTVWSRYVDRWSKRNGRWGLDKRIAIRDFDLVREVTPLSGLETEGHRDQQDPSYAVFKKLHNL